MAEQFQVSVRGLMLAGHCWQAGEAERNLCVITGMDEYSLRYERFAEWLTGRGVNVWVLDAPGQGLNAVSVERQQEWPDDAFAISAEAVREMILLAGRNGLPTFQMGHSMGSFITQSLLERFPALTDGIILCGSNGGQGMLMKLAFRLASARTNEKNRNTPDPLMTALSFGPYIRSVRNRKTDFDWLSRDEENVRRYIADPWCGHPNTRGFWREFLRGMAVLWDEKEMKRISPDENILIIAGTEDPVGQCGKGPEWLAASYRKLGVRNTELILYDGMRHEILNEQERETVFEDILAFMKQCGRKES